MRGAAGKPRARPRPPQPALTAKSQSRAPSASGDKEPRSGRQSRQRARRPSGGCGLCAPRARRAAAGRLPLAAWSTSEPGTARTSSSPPRVRRGGPEAQAPSWASAGPLRSLRWEGDAPGKPQHPWRAVRAQRRLSARRGRGLTARWRLGAAGAPEGEGGSPARALRRPPSERRACCSVCCCCCRRRHGQLVSGPRRKLRFSGCKSATLAS